MTFLYISLGFIVGLLLGWHITKTKYHVLTKAAELQFINSQEQLTTAKSSLKEANSQLLHLNGEVARLETLNTGLTEKLDEQQQALQKMEDKLSMQFENLANKLLEEKSIKFTDQNKINIEAILKPLGERITSFEKKVEDTNKEGIERNAGLKAEITMLHDLNMKITKEAENLTNAIKGNKKIQGNWGELILEAILEQSGLIKDRDYLVQPSMVAEDGKYYQPDIIIKLPTAKEIIIDAKVSLINYEQFFNTQDDEEKTTQLKNHLLSIRRHIRTLSAKNYQTLPQVTCLDFVLLFIPIETALSLAVNYDHTILDEAYQKNIILTSPTTLIAALKIIANIWKQDRQNQNALEIARKSGALYDKFVAFFEDLKKVGDSLKEAQGAYTGAMKKLYEGKGNIVGKIEKIKALGANATKSLNPQLLKRAQVGDLLEDLTQ